MALSCSSSLISPESFEFIDCSTISVTYVATGEASISFTVVTTDLTLNNDYTSMTFGGVDYNGYIVDVTVNRIPGTLVYLFNISYKAFGC